MSGTPVIGYRAPNFSIGQKQSWAYDILLETGYRYDSSIYPSYTIGTDRRTRPDQNRLRVEMAIDDRTLPMLVPTLLLQPLVENAVRHGIGQRRSAGALRIPQRRFVELSSSSRCATTARGFRLAFASG